MPALSPKCLRYLMTALVLGLLVCQPAIADSAPRSYLVGGTRPLVRFGEEFIRAEPCKTETRSVEFHISDVESLDPSFKKKGLPPGLDLDVTGAAGAVSWSVVSFENGILRLNLKAVGGGKPMNAPDRPQWCENQSYASMTIQAVAHYLPVSPSKDTAFAPTPDLRVAIRTPLLTTAVGDFDHYTLGQWIRLGEGPFYCGDRTQFDINIRERPILTFSGWLNTTVDPPDYGTLLALYVLARAQVHGCLGDPIAEGEIKATAPFSSLTGSTIPINANAHVRAICVSGTCFLDRDFPFGFSLPIPAQALTSFPIDLPSGAGAALEFGQLVNNSWKPSATPHHKDIPVELNAGSFGGAAGNNQTLIMDAYVGGRRSVPVSGGAAAQAAFEADDPVYDARDDVGITVRQSLFGNRDASTPPHGLLGALLPIRITKEFDGKFLFFKIRKKVEVILDGAAVSFTKNEGADAVRVAISSSHLKIGNGSLVGGPSAVKAVEGAVLFDRLAFQNDAFKFRVADFRVNVKTHLLGIIPIKLSSGQLESELNGGVLPITGDMQATVALPMCVQANYEKFISPWDTCSHVPLIGPLGYLRGPRTETFQLDPSSVKIRLWSDGTSGVKWQGLQVSASIVRK